MPNFLFAALYIGFFIDWVYKKDFKAKRLIPLTFVLVIIMNGALNFKRTSHFNDDFVYKWAEKSLQSLEPNSVLILCGQEPYALYYTHQFKKIRPDVTVYDRLSIMTKENLYAPHLLFWKVKTVEQFENYRKFKELELFKSSNRPIYLTCKDKFNDYGIILKPTVYFYRLISHIPFSHTNLSKTLHQEVLEAAINSYPKNEYWLDSIRNMVLFNTFSFYLENNPSEIPSFLERLKKHKNSRDQDFMHSLLEDTYLKKKVTQYEALLKWNIDLNGIENLQAGTLSRACTVRAAGKRFKEALNYCHKAIKVSKECNIPLLNNLLFINYNLKNLSEAKKWAENIIACKPDHKGANSLLKSIR
jgi:tetratricopeptide (TPR) repeat protein